MKCYVCGRQTTNKVDDQYVCEECLVPTEAPVEELGVICEMVIGQRVDGSIFVDIDGEQVNILTAYGLLEAAKNILDRELNNIIGGE